MQALRHTQHHALWPSRTASALVAFLALALLLAAAAAREARAADGPVRYANRFGMTFVLLPAGSFFMGSPPSLGQEDEHPRHEVAISRPFYLQTTEVTRGQWRAVTGRDKSQIAGDDDYPVEDIGFAEAAAFIDKLNQLDGGGYYLPTEAQWEYACRAGSDTAFCFGDDIRGLDAYAWHRGNTAESRPVAAKKPNAWGLYDMHGGVHEWVADWYAADYYARSPKTDPAGPETGTDKVLRGGSWAMEPGWLRSAFRWYGPCEVNFLIGLRVARRADNDVPRSVDAK